MRQIKYKVKDVFPAVLFAVISGLLLFSCSTAQESKNETEESFCLEGGVVSHYNAKEDKEVQRSESFSLESQMGKENSRSEHFILQRQ